MNIQKNSLLLLSALSVAFGAGCLGLKPKADPTKFYVLTSPAGKTEHQTNQSLSVRLGRIDLAAYLENPGIALRRGENQIEYLQDYNWAEQLHSGIERVVREDISRSLGIGVGRNSATRGPVDRNVEVRLTISRFELTDKNQAVVAASWQISDAKYGNLPLMGQAEIKRNFVGLKTDAKPGVAALSIALDEICQRIAQDIQAER